MKIFRNSNHQKERSYDILVIEKFSRKVKMVYEAYNGVEEMDCFLFDGNRWNKILDLKDLGENKNGYAFIDAKEQGKTRASSLFDKAEKLVELILK